MNKDDDSEVPPFVQSPNARARDFRREIKRRITWHWEIVKRYEDPDEDWCRSICGWERGPDKVNDSNLIYRAHDHMENDLALRRLEEIDEELASRKHTLTAEELAERYGDDFTLLSWCEVCDQCGFQGPVCVCGDPPDYYSATAALCMTCLRAAYDSGSPEVEMGEKDPSDEYHVRRTNLTRKEIKRAMLMLEADAL